jgi:phosphohistidine phosphatase
MKTLLLVRHAKSSWQDAALADHDRPLNARGLRDAPRIAAYLATHYPKPDIIYSSSALRATTTAQTIADAFGVRDRLVNDPALYTFSDMALLTFIRSLDRRYDFVMLSGHNPAITDLVNRLSGAGIENVPTCGVALLSVPCNEWDAIADASAELVDFVTPKTI